MKTLLITRKTRGAPVLVPVPVPVIHLGFLCFASVSPTAGADFVFVPCGSFLAFRFPLSSSKDWLDPRTEGCLLIFTWGYLRVFVALCFRSFSLFWGWTPKKNTPNAERRKGKIMKWKRCWRRYVFAGPQFSCSLNNFASWKFFPGCPHPRISGTRIRSIIEASA